MKLPKLPTKQDTALIQAQLRIDLSDALRAELKRNGVKINEFVEWAAKTYLLNTNPREAQKLGIDTNE